MSAGPTSFDRTGEDGRRDERNRIVGQLLAKRGKLGWTQRETAELAGLRTRQLSDIECRRGSPTLLTLLKIAGALGLRLELVDSD